MTHRRVDYPDGDTSLAGELYQPTRSNGRAILVVHEADGIGGNVRRRCGLLADLGYVAFAADLHGEGRVLEGDAMHVAVQAFLADPQRLRRRAAAALEALAAQPFVEPSKIAAIGYCFGGTTALELARGGQDLAGVVSFHGLLTSRRPAQVTPRARIAVFTGGMDPLVPAADVDAFRAEMAAVGADWQLTVYGQAWHSFTNVGVEGSTDTRMRYDPTADRQSWRAALGFLDEVFA